MNRFSDIVEAADNLSPEEQAALVELLRHRLAERNRRELVIEVAEARAEFRNGDLKPGTASSIMGEILDES